MLDKFEAAMDEARDIARWKFGDDATVEYRRGVIVVFVNDEIVAEWDLVEPNEAEVRY